MAKGKPFGGKQAQPFGKKTANGGGSGKQKTAPSSGSSKKSK